MKSWMSFWTRPKALVTIVTAAHCLVLIGFVTSETPAVVRNEPTRLVVSTVKLKPKRKPKPAPKAVVAAAKPVHKPKPKRAPKKKSNDRLAKLMREAQDKLSKVANNAESTQTKTVQLDLAIDSGTYEHELAERLRLLLKLPEWGSVRVALTLTRNGRVLGLEILESQSDTNRAYVASHLEGQALAPFGKEYDGEAQHTFRLTLNNEL